MSIFDGKHFYNQTLKKCVAVFGTIFNNIKISQFQKGEVRVPIDWPSPVSGKINQVLN